MRLIFNLLTKTANFGIPLHSGVFQIRCISKFKMAASSYKDFGPLVGAIDQGTSSSRFLVSEGSYLYNFLNYINYFFRFL